MANRARILADSIYAGGFRLTTMEVELGRPLLAELNTHRMFTRNSASSRAIPVEKQLDRVKNEPFIPVHFGANQPGMQADAELEGEARIAAEHEWLAARDSAVIHAERMKELGLHKQVANRILEPFMWHTVIITATEWSNFFALRANPQAQPEIRVVAEMMQECYRRNEPRLIEEGQWHLPLIQDSERDGVFEYTENARKISAARCARVSYLTHDGKRDLDADITLYERLVGGGHMSPLEHVATPFSHDEVLLRATTAAHVVTASNSLGFSNSSAILESLMFNGNFRGWTQLRKFIPNEHDFSLVEGR